MNAGARSDYSFDAIIFEPSIRHLIAHARPRPGEQVLDVACGSGIAACKSAAQVGAAGRITGLDIGANILHKAISLYAGEAPAAWVRGDFQDLPFADGSFDLTLCHQGLQFAADPTAAAAEMRRVTRPGGRAVFMSWTAIADCPFFLALESAVRRHLGERAGDFAAAPFVLPDADGLARILGAAFASVDLERVSIDTTHPSAGAFAAAFMSYIPESALPETDRGLREGRVVRDVSERLAPWRVDGELRAPIVSHVAVCR